jgi:hypothetical protein
MLACLPPKKKTKKEGYRYRYREQRMPVSRGVHSLALIDPPPRRKKEKKKKTPESVCHAQIGTSHTNPCIPEQGRKAKAEDVD